MRWWSEWEDGRPGACPFLTLHGANTPQEFVRIEMAPRILPARLRHRNERIVIREFRSGKVTISLEAIRVETSR